MDDLEFDDARIWRVAAPAPLATITNEPADDQYAEEFALNDIGLALRFSSADR